ncbi:hypothetical protein ACWT_5929 [Actinoplanes sp. SE50]|uniref:hypothetical protein n=1 Tax=unclassified Actinoplanes TaxID=2626549 RepID=UPI00023EC161|nr:MULTISPECIES: hypothetical protein [unclassified Actinoplanes]AEV86948.1 hypothetical protein ACPL_6061 [Actinoplanes sp. SE50/110]ATO85344.1 hypothetical protein ACWT_5929 [Actinoplanes sp. SE50]SLM02755.1 uncharacterized protein ACSP50_6040 [Actinoplanes sp. SE50/110]
MDATEAAKALAEIDQRGRQTLRQGSPRRVPAWFAYGSAAALALACAGNDMTGWVRTAMLLTGAATLIILAAAMDRVTGVRLRMRAVRRAPWALFAAAVLATVIGVGTVLRLLDVPADGTLSGLAGALVWITAIGPTQAAAGAPRNPA